MLNLRASMVVTKRQKYRSERNARSLTTRMDMIDNLSYKVRQCHWDSMEEIKHVAENVT